MQSFMNFGYTLISIAIIGLSTPVFSNSDNDTDRDGIPDLIEGMTDTDLDGVPNYLDLDSDNDGTPDSQEAGIDPNNPIDTDSDGQPDFLDSDSDNDGIPDSLESVITDTDSDGVPDTQDSDSDNDGIPDSVEGTANTDSDLLPNFLDWDSDEDGIPDFAEAGPDPFQPIDSDNDGTPNFLDLDSDNDTIPDSIELLNDADFDGVPTYIDLDSDNDGIPDQVKGLADANENGIFDYIEVEAIDPSSSIDTDGDGVFDSEDQDDDNDGLLDFQESAEDDLDGDGIVNSLDLDSDNDGICDLQEGGGVNPDSGCRYELDGGVFGIPSVITRFPISLFDQDMDGIASVLDLDSDGDTLWDLTENGQFDIDNDGIIDRFLDENSDGADDTSSYVLLDLDGDSIGDYVDDFIGIPELEPQPTTETIAVASNFMALDAPAAFETNADGFGGCTVTKGANDISLILLLGMALIAVSHRKVRYSFILIPLFTTACTISNNPGTFKQSLYFHVGAGASKLDPQPLSTSSVSDDSSESSTVTFGADLTRDFSFEVSSHSLGEAAIAPAGFIDYRIVPSVSVIRYAFRSPAAQRARVGFAGFGRLGAAVIENDSNLPIRQENETTVLLGLGAEYILRNGLGFRAELQSFNSDAQSITAGITYRFGPRPQNRATENRFPITQPPAPKKTRIPPKVIPRE